MWIRECCVYVGPDTGELTLVHLGAAVGVQASGTGVAVEAEEGKGGDLRLERGRGKEWV